MKHHLGPWPPRCLASVFRACELLCLWSAKHPPTHTHTPGSTQHCCTLLLLPFGDSVQLSTGGHGKQSFLLRLDNIYWKDPCLRSYKEGFCWGYFCIIALSSLTIWEPNNHLITSAQNWIIKQCLYSLGICSSQLWVFTLKQWVLHPQQSRKMT